MLRLAFGVLLGATVATVGSARADDMLRLSDIRLDRITAARNIALVTTGGSIAGVGASLMLQARTTVEDGSSSLADSMVEAHSADASAGAAGTAFAAGDETIASTVTFVTLAEQSGAASSLASSSAGLGGSAVTTAIASAASAID